MGSSLTSTAIDCPPPLAAAFEGSFEASGAAFADLVLPGAWACSAAPGAAYDDGACASISPPKRRTAASIAIACAPRISICLSELGGRVGHISRPWRDPNAVFSRPEAVARRMSRDATWTGPASRAAGPTSYGRRRWHRDGTRPAV